MRGASSVLWGEPTRITPQVCSVVSEQCALSFEEPTPDRGSDVLRRTNLERLFRYLEQKNGMRGLEDRAPDVAPLAAFHGHSRRGQGSSSLIRARDVITLVLAPQAAGAGRCGQISNRTSVASRDQ